jgi:hypothetical protein
MHCIVPHIVVDSFGPIAAIAVGFRSGLSQFAQLQAKRSNGATQKMAMNIL